MVKKELKLIADEFLFSTSADYFEDNKIRLKELDIKKEDVLRYREREDLGYLSMIDDLIKTDADRAIAVISSSLESAFEPSNKYIKKVIEVLKSFHNNQDILNILFGYDPAEMYGASAHTSICNDLICDSNFYETLHGNTYPLFRKGFCNYTDTHFYGFIPYVFFNFPKKYYNDLLNFAFNIIKKIPDKTLALLFNLYHFTKEFDKENHETFVKLIRINEKLFNSYKMTFIEGFGISAGDLIFEYRNQIIKKYL